MSKFDADRIVTGVSSKNQFSKTLTIKSFNDFVCGFRIVGYNCVRAAINKLFDFVIVVYRPELHRNAIVVAIVDKRFLTHIEKRDMRDLQDFETDVALIEIDVKQKSVIGK